MGAKPTSVKQYLDALPSDRRAAIEAVRKVILKNLPKGYEEGIQYGMIGYFVPHTLYPHGYHCDPTQALPFASLASQKNHMAAYLMCIYGDKAHETWFRGAWAKSGKKLDMGKSCVRFKRVDDLALDVIGAAIKKVPVKKYVEAYESNLPAAVKKKIAKANAAGGGTSAGKPASKKTTKKKTVAKKVAKKKTAVRKATSKNKVTKKKVRKKAPGRR